MYHISNLTSIATTLGALGSAGAAIAAVKGLSDSKRYQVLQTRPIVVLERSGKPEGQQWDASGRDPFLVSSGYGFRVTNYGVGPAILGNDPFRSVDNMKLLTEVLHGKELRGPFVTTIDSRSYIPNVLAPNTGFNVVISTGYLERKPMDNPWQFLIYYSDIHGIPFLTIVSIDPLTGNVVKLEHIGGVRNTWWNRLKREFTEDMRRQ